MKNKKAQVFTLLAISLVVLMFLSIEIYSSIREKEVVQTRVSSMDSFLQSLETNMQRQVYIVGFRLIFLATTHIKESGAYINDLDGFFDEAFFYGTVGGEPNNLMAGITYDNISDSINSKAAKINAQLEMENPVLELSQDDPWNVKVTLTSDFVMKDKEGLAIWDKTQTITSYVSIIDLLDPVYLFESNGQVPRKINKTIYEGDYVVGGDVSNLLDHFNKGYYAANPDAPNFLQRLKGDFTTDPDGNGIETFVDTNELVGLGGGSIDLSDFDPNGQKSKIDYIYFDRTKNLNPTYYGSTVSGMPPRFLIDDGHKSFYQII